MLHQSTTEQNLIVHIINSLKLK